MIEVKIPKDIQEYKSKLIAGMSTRQIIAIAGALAVGVPLGVAGYGRISGDTLSWLVILSVAPFAGWGWFTFKDMKFEVFMKSFLSMNFLPQRRVYEDTDINLFCSLHEEIAENEIVNQHIENGDYEDE
ncbi:MAG TPA: PrgI family protein [Ruminococcus sp.]|mgnify:CR=1 FL=1|nr:PrgI family protein [Ruminococcus sp.]HCR73095.1 PrgI family protein [Ruminococcus sp.]